MQWQVTGIHAWRRRGGSAATVQAIHTVTGAWIPPTRAWRMDAAIPRNHAHAWRSDTAAVGTHNLYSPAQSATEHDWRIQTRVRDMPEPEGPLCKASLVSPLCSPKRHRRPVTNSSMAPASSFAIIRGDLASWWRLMTRHAAARRRFPLTDRTWVSNRINQRPDQLLLPLRCAMMRHLSCAYPTSGCNYVKGGAAQRCRLGGSRLRLGAQEGRRRVRVASSDKNDQNQLGDDLLGETLLQDPCMSTYR